ncbi:MAG TPA: hypothetical protein VEY33_08255 [Gemmatimonadota bacterium]|nr:hypothetical protein [Gemmatimonadota bacterium]
MKGVTMARVSNLDEFLHVAYSAGVPDPEDHLDVSEAQEVPVDLRRRVIERAAQASSEFLAEMLDEAAREGGWAPDELSYEAIGHETEAALVLRGRGDPRDVSPIGMAQLFHTVGLEPDGWQQLLTQTVASFVTFPTSGTQVLGRTTGLSPEERARALRGPESRDPARARKVAENFVEEVNEAWATLTSGRKRKNDEGL